ALLQRNPHPTEDDVRQAVAGNTCRCGTYPKVFEAALAAAGTAPAKAGPPHGDLPAAALAASGATAYGNTSPVVGGTAETDAAKAQDKGGGEASRTFQVGLSGALQAKERKVPTSEPAAWDGSARLQILGQRVPRIDGPEKVTGRARYCFDVQLPGMLHAAVVRSPHAHRWCSRARLNRRAPRAAAAPPRTSRSRATCAGRWSAATTATWRKRSPPARSGWSRSTGRKCRPIPPSRRTASSPTGARTAPR